MSKSLAGFVSLGIETASFCVPIYSEGMRFFTHILDSKAEKIIGFSETKLPGYEENIPKVMQKEVVEGDDALFVVIQKSLLFIGNKKELETLLSGQLRIGGENFKKEIEELMSC